MRLDWLHRPKSVQPYSQLAFIYDYVMRHVNYPNWATYLSRLFRKADVEVKDVLDISCGTGNLLLHLLDLDYAVAGLDASESMLKVAQSKTQHRRRPIPIWLGSMANFSVSKLFQAIICTYDSMNYCLDEGAVVATFRHASNALCSGGVFIFDICTLRNSKRNFRRYYEMDGTNEFRYSRMSYFLMHKRIQVNKFFIEWNSDSRRSFVETHKQKIFSIREIENIVPEESFEIVGIYDGFSLRAGSEKSTRVHFVLKRI